jgi:hypothetical protein
MACPSGHRYRRIRYGPKQRVVWKCEVLFLGRKFICFRCVQEFTMTNAIKHSTRRRPNCGCVAKRKLQAKSTDEMLKELVGKIKL